MNGRSIRSGALAGAGLVLFYVVVVAGASGSWDHLADQVRGDWYFLVAIIGGFGVQVALLSELRRRHRLHHRDAAAGGAGAGASTVGMVACCAHHIATIQPRQLDAQGAVFDVALDTHSAELSMDLDSAQLQVDGITWPITGWDGDGPGGHHREGELRFEPAGPVADTARLILGGFGEPVEVDWPLGTVQDADPDAAL